MGRAADVNGAKHPTINSRPHIATHPNRSVGLRSVPNSSQDATPRRASHPLRSLFIRPSHGSDRHSNRSIERTICPNTLLNIGPDRRPDSAQASGHYCWSGHVRNASNYFWHSVGHCQGHRQGHCRDQCCLYRQTSNTWHYRVPHLMPSIAHNCVVCCWNCAVHGLLLNLGTNLLHNRDHGNEAYACHSRTARHRQDYRCDTAHRMPSGWCKNRSPGGGRDLRRCIPTDELRRPAHG